MAHPILDRLSEPKVRLWIAGGVVILALALGGYALAGRGKTQAQAGDGPRLNIAVVPPVEHSVQPGDVMDVGALTNGFDGRLPDRVDQASSDVDLYAEQPAYVENDASWHSDAARDRDVYDNRNPDDGYRRQTYDDRPDPRGSDRPRERPLSFGFDQPQPDWRAEREARRAALDARERETNARRDRRYSSSGDRSGLSPDSEFY